MYEGNKREKEIVGTIEAPLKVSKWHMDCILSGAFEGGSNYWCDRIEVVDGDYKGADFASDAISNGAEIDVWTIDDDEKFRLTQKKLLKGCQLYVTGDKNTKPRAFDIDRWDAIDHDMIFQYAIFGEVVYG